MRASKDQFETPFGTFALQRYPRNPSSGELQAWCAADRLLLDETHARRVPGAAILVVNDTHGALSVALAPSALWTDSALAMLALRQNERANNRAATPVIWSTGSPLHVPQLVVLRIPKYRPLFEHQLAHIARLLPEGSTLLAAGMDKHLSPHAANILEQYIGPTERHRGRYKARLFTAVRSANAPPTVPVATSYYCEQLGTDLAGLPNVFSREQLDLGSRLLLSQIERLAPVNTAIDLACGNGVLGLVAATRGLCRSVVFCDESAMAVASARANATKILGPTDIVTRFHHGDGLADYSGEAVDLIVCNPPFHLDHTVDDFAGRRLLQQCHSWLLPGGQLCFVANRHLRYQTGLHARYQVRKLAGDSKFNVWLARKT